MSIILLMCLSMKVCNLEDGNIEVDPDWESTDYTASSGTESSYKKRHRADANP